MQDKPHITRSYPPNAILLDNTSYFSLKGAIEDEVFDAHTIHNVATLLESLVLGEAIFFAPSTIWHPSPSEDVIFRPGGPCHQLTFESWDLDDIIALFHQAIKRSQKDLQQTATVDVLPPVAFDRTKALNLLGEMASVLQRRPGQFLDVYSDAVLYIDKAAQAFMGRYFGKSWSSFPGEKHIAQFLLRTNAAYLLSEQLVYLPNAHRVPFIKVPAGYPAALLRGGKRGSP